MFSSIHGEHFGKWKLQLAVVEYGQYAVLLSMGDTHVCASKYAQPLIMQQPHIFAPRHGIEGILIENCM